MVIIVWRLSLGHYIFAAAVDAPFAGIKMHFHVMDMSQLVKL